MSVDENNLMNWYAYAQHHSHEETARMLMQQADEVVRLRETCRDAAKRLAMVTINMTPGGKVLTHTLGVIADLEFAGKEARNAK